MLAFLSTYGLDILIALVLAYYAVDGYYRGAVIAAFDSLGFLVSYFAATGLYRFPAEWIEASFGMPRAFASAMALFGIWTAVDLCWPLASKHLRHRLPHEWANAPWNRRLGPVPGMLNAGFLLSVFLTVALAFPLPSPYKDAIGGSAMAWPFLVAGERVDFALRPALGPLAEAGVNLLTVRPKSDATIDLHFTVHDGKTDGVAERAMFDLVNGVRRADGRAALAWSETLAEVARAHARDMLARGYFSHKDPSGRDAAARLDAARIGYLAVGENLALAPDVGTAHRGLMESPGHRANVLHAGFGRVGIGVIDGGVYGKMYVQLFAD